LRYSSIFPSCPNRFRNAAIALACSKWRSMGHHSPNTFDGFILVRGRIAGRFPCVFCVESFLTRQRKIVCDRSCSAKSRIDSMLSLTVSDSMSTFLRTLEFLGLGLWLGSDVFLSFVVAPGAFRILASRDQAGAMVGFALWWMHMIGVVCGVTILVTRVLRTRTFANLATPAALCVVLMIALTVVSQHAVSPRMAALRVQMGSIQATAADSPLLAEFTRLHRISVSLESGVLLAGFAALYLMVRELAAAN
jgi:uncharacterized membrane protein